MSILLEVFLLEELFQCCTNVIDYITISTTGNAQDFGDLTVQCIKWCFWCGSATRGVIAGGGVPPSTNNTIEFITIASTGNAQDFGDLTAVQTMESLVCSTTRGILGAVNPAFVSNGLCNYRNNRKWTDFLVI